MFDRNILLFISHELGMKHGRFVPASCLYPPYICMYACLLQCVWPSALSCVCFAYLYIIVTNIFYVYSLCYPCTYIHHTSLHVLFTVHTWPRSYSYTLTMVDKGLEILHWVLTDISWWVKCSKLHCLGFLTAVKTVLFPVLLDLKVSRV